MFHHHALATRASVWAIAFACALRNWISKCPCVDRLALQSSWLICNWHRGVEIKTYVPRTAEAPTKKSVWNYQRVAPQLAISPTLEAQGQLNLRVWQPMYLSSGIMEKNSSKHTWNLCWGRRFKSITLVASLSISLSRENTWPLQGIWKKPLVTIEMDCHIALSSHAAEREYKLPFKPVPEEQAPRNCGS